MNDLGSRLLTPVAMLLGLAFVGSAAELVAQESGDSNSEQVAADAGLEMGQTDLFRAMALTAKSFRVAVKKIEPALVTIESFGGVSAVQGRIGGIRRQGEGNTTGVMISPDGYVLTSTFNFIQQPAVITVITSDGKRRLAKMLGRDDTRKICLLKIDGVEDMPVPELVDESATEVGQWAASLGVGYGDTRPALSVGIISAKNRIGGRAIQTDANISPANYGGPLIDIQGRMIGICVPMNPQSQAIGAGVEWYDSGIGFAIPIASTGSLMERLKSGERILPAFIGIQYTVNPKGAGMFIMRVVQGTAASEAGLQVEDILLKINGEQVDDMLRLRQILNQFESGNTVELTVIRSETGEQETLKIKLGVPPSPEGEPEPLEPPKIR